MKLKIVSLQRIEIKCFLKMILTMIPLGLSTMDLTWGPILGRGRGVAVDLPVGHWSVIIRFRGNYKVKFVI